MPLNKGFVLGCGLSMSLCMVQDFLCVVAGTCKKKALEVDRSDVSK